MAVLDNRGDLAVNVCLGASEEDNEKYLNTGGPDPAINPRTRAIVTAPALHAMVDADYTSRDDLSKNPFYNEFFVPLDLPFACLTKLFEDDSGIAGLTLLMPSRNGHVDERTRSFVSRIVPQIADVVRGSLSLTRTQNATLAALAAATQGNVILLGQDMCIRVVSDGAERCLRVGTYLSTRAGRLQCADPCSQRRLQQSLAEVCAPIKPGNRLRIPLDLASRCGTTILSTELVALPPPAFDGLLQTRAILILHDRVDMDPAGLAALRRYFGLTEAEMSVCALLASGADARQIADRRGSAIGTVRNQIKVALEKTGTNRQVDLVLRIRNTLGSLRPGF